MIESNSSQYLITISILNHSPLNYSQIFRRSNSNISTPEHDIRSYIIIQKTNELFLLIGEKKSQQVNEEWLTSHLDKIKFDLKKQVFIHLVNTNKINVENKKSLSDEEITCSNNNNFLSQPVINFINNIRLFTNNSAKFNKKYTFLNISSLNKQLLRIKYKNIFELKTFLKNQSQSKKFYIPDLIQEIDDFFKKFLTKETILEEEQVIIQEKIIQINELTKILNLSHQEIQDRLDFYTKFTRSTEFLNDIKCLEDTCKLIINLNDHLKEMNKILSKYVSKTADA
ncbi:MAG: hypothetical protein Q8K60_02600 [Parachlamydiaceae bacterium]|nr:hypothetical protein [Parachlamydiaceae bacterium]